MEPKRSTKGPLSLTSRRRCKLSYGSVQAGQAAQLQGLTSLYQKAGKTYDLETAGSNRRFGGVVKFKIFWNETVSSNQLWHPPCRVRSPEWRALLLSPNAPSRPDAAAEGFQEHDTIPVFSQINPLRTLPSHSFEGNFNIIFTSTPSGYSSPFQVFLQYTSCVLFS